MHLIGQHKI